MEFITLIFDFFLHLDKYLTIIIENYGNLTYLILFLTIFLETGLVVTPFLPGDSLIFAAGAFAARGSLKIGLIFILLSIAAIVGDTVNYWIGKFFGQKILEKANNRIIRKEYIEKTQKFFEKYGGKTIFIARFIPIVRTFAPFMAGIGKMNYGKFLSYNVVGAISWISLFVFGGYFFGNISFVKENFSLVIIIIILISISPGIIGYLRKNK
jgi:membrane-associated protein